MAHALTWQITRRAREHSVAFASRSIMESFVSLRRMFALGKRAPGRGDALTTRVFPRVNASSFIRAEIVK